MENALSGRFLPKSSMPLKVFRTLETVFRDSPEQCAARQADAGSVLLTLSGVWKAAQRCAQRQSTPTSKYGGDGALTIEARVTSSE